MNRQSPIVNRQLSSDGDFPAVPAGWLPIAWARECRQRAVNQVDPAVGERFRAWAEKIEREEARWYEEDKRLALTLDAIERDRCRPRRY